MYLNGATCFEKYYFYNKKLTAPKKPRTKQAGLFEVTQTHKTLLEIPNFIKPTTQNIRKANFTILGPTFHSIMIKKFKLKNLTINRVI